jgi:hypothetical protein
VCLVSAPGGTRVRGSGVCTAVNGIVSLAGRRTHLSFHYYKSVKFVVGALRRLDWTWKTVGRLDRLYIRRVHLWWVSRWIPLSQAT